MSAVVVEYGMGNIASLSNALRHLGADVVLSADPEVILGAERVLLPGVGAFGRCMHELRARGLVETVRAVIARGQPLLGICLGFQVLFERSTEHVGDEGDHDGLGAIPGAITRFAGPGLVVPHMGWNEVVQTRPHPLFEGIADRAHFYFVHSFRPESAPADWTIGAAEYGGTFPCAVARGSVAGVQFHPEKSGSNGLRLLRNFLAWTPDRSAP